MSYRQITEATDALEVVLRRYFQRQDVDDAVEAMKELAAAMAEDALDRQFNRGDYSGW